MNVIVCTISGMICQKDDQRDKGQEIALYQLPWRTSFFFRPLGRVTDEASAIIAFLMNQIPFYSTISRVGCQQKDQKDICNVSGSDP